MPQTHDRALLLVTEAVSDALDVPVEELPPLSESISLDGLDALLRNSEGRDVRVIFSYSGLQVFVHSAGFVYVRPMYDDGASELDGAFAHGR